MKRLLATSTLGGGALIAGLLAAAAAPAQASDGASACSSAQPPTANTWRDPNGNYRGTRVAYSDRIYNLSTVVYETFGHNYYRVETWSEGGSFGINQPIDCKQEPKQAEPNPPAPVPISSGGVVGGGGVKLPTRGYSVMISNPVIRTGTVTVGPAKPIGVNTVAE